MKIRMNKKNISVNMIKEIVISVLLFTVGFTSFGQIGIGNTNPKAQLDITAANAATPTATDGILIPRVDAFPATNPTADQNGMLLFLTTDNSFYYWNNATASWNQLAESNSGWKKTGNAGTVSGTNFIGTTDNVDFVVRTNNIAHTTFTADGNLGIGLTNPTSKLEVKGSADVPQMTIIANSTQSISNPLIQLKKADGTELLDINSDSPFNAFVGLDAGVVNTGAFNSFFGSEAGSKNGGGSVNTFIGHQAGKENSSGSSNTFIGAGSAKNHTTGDFNIFLGSNSGFDNLSGESNVFVGDYSGRNNNGSNNTFIGQGAGYNNTLGNDNVFIGTSTGSQSSGSNKLYIDNSNTNTPLIYGEFDNDLVRINGELNLIGKLTGEGANLTENTTTATGWYPSSTFLLTATPPASGAHNYFSFDTEMNIDGTNDVTTNDIGSAGIFVTGSSNTTGTVARLSGIEAQAYGTAGTVTELNGVSGLVAFNSFNPGTVTDAVAIRAEAGYNVGAPGAVINAYGVYIEKQDFGTNNWGLYSEGAQNNYIEGNLGVGVGVSNPQRALHISDVMRLEPRTDAPASPSEGDIYVNSTDHHMYCYLGGAWKQLD